MSHIEQLHKLEREKWPNTSTGKFREWLDKFARNFTEVDVTESATVRDRVHARLKECYHNCFVSAYPRYDYYEGYVWSNSIQIPIEHAWLVKDNKVVDPTLAIELDNPPIKNRFGDEYRGVHIPWDTLLHFAGKDMTSGPFLFDYWELTKTY